MSSKTRGRKPSEGAGKQAETQKREVKPSGHRPVAIVVSRHGVGLVSRQSRGFSLRELSSAGLPLRLARAWEVDVDPKRRSSRQENVASLKKWYTPTPKAPAAPAPTAAAPAKAPAKAKKGVKRRAPRRRGESSQSATG